MNTFIQDLVNRFELLWKREINDGYSSRQKGTLIIISVFCCLAAIIFGIRYYLQFGVNAYVALPAAFTIVIALGLTAFFITKRFTAILYPFLVMILCIPVLFHFALGGFSGQTGTGTIVWAILGPLGALMFLSIRKAAWWFLAYLVLIITAVLLDKHVVPFIVISSYEDNLSAHGMNLFLISITIFFTVRYFVLAFQREQAKAEQLVAELSQSNTVLERTLDELKATQAELVQSEKMASLGKLAAGIAHEINNPIGALRSSANTTIQCISKLIEYIESSAEMKLISNDSRFQRYLQIIKDNSSVFMAVSDRVGNTIKGFASFARLDSAGFDKYDIHSGIESTLMLLKNEIEPQLEIEKSYGEIPMIACYPGELNQVFMNILTNAVQAISGYGKIKIKTSVELKTVIIEISDDGIGIAEEQLLNLFNPGFSNSGKRVKAGLGLFTSYNIIRQHQGSIQVQSKEGEGSTFTIILPIDLEARSHSTIIE